MMRVAGDICRNCEFWSNELPPLANATRRAAGSDPDRGTCHAFAPVVVIMAGIPVTLFPETHASRTCGGWSPQMPNDDDPDGDGPDDGEEHPKLTAEVIDIRRAA